MAIALRKLLKVDAVPKQVELGGQPRIIAKLRSHQVGDTNDPLWNAARAQAQQRAIQAQAGARSNHALKMPDHRAAGQSRCQAAKGMRPHTDGLHHGGPAAAQKARQAKDPDQPDQHVCQQCQRVGNFTALAEVERRGEKWRARQIVNRDVQGAQALGQWARAGQEHAWLPAQCGQARRQHQNIHLGAANLGGFVKKDHGTIHEGAASAASSRPSAMAASIRPETQPTRPPISGFQRTCSEAAATSNTTSVIWPARTYRATSES